MLQDHVLQHPQGIIVYKDRGCYPQVLITTGSAPGIRLTASRSLEEGARVFGLDVSPSPMSLTERPQFRFLKCGFTDKSMERIVDTFLHAYAGIDDHMAFVIVFLFFISCISTPLIHIYYVGLQYIFIIHIRLVQNA
jgi:hypothetical protein